LTVSNLATGSHSIIASYSGDANFLPSDSQALDEVVVSPPATSADLAISETASDRRVEPGELLVCLLKVTNKGPDTAVSLNVTDTLPAGTAFLRAHTNKDTCTGPAVGSAGTLSCGLNSLNAGNAAWLIQGAVRVRAKGGSTLTNTASVISSTPDPNLLNNSATVITRVVVEVEEEEDDRRGRRSAGNLTPRKVK
jgi:uncharacterized repeat protein (TIGR01451 family)